MSEWKWRLIVVGAILLACSVSYCVGKKQQSMDDSLKVNQDSIHVRDSVVRVDSSKVDSAKKTAAILTTYRSHVREKVVTHHDTITVHDSVVAVSPEIAQLVQADDSTIAALRNVIGAQDTLIADLRSGLTLRDGRIHLLESERTPGKLRRIITATRWLAIGAVVGVAIAHR